MAKNNSEVNPRQNGVYKTNKVVLELLNKIQIAPPEEGPLFAANSKIGVRMVDYSKTPSEVVEDNITISNLLELFEESKMRRANYNFSQSKIFGEPDKDGKCIARKITILRQSKMPNGEVKKSPWYIKIENGKGIKIKNDNGSAYMKGDSFKAEKTVYTNLVDADFFDLVLQMERQIRMMELTYGPEHTRQNQMMIQQNDEKWKNKGNSAPAGNASQNTHASSSGQQAPTPQNRNASGQSANTSRQKPSANQNQPKPAGNTQQTQAASNQQTKPAQTQNQQSKPADNEAQEPAKNQKPAVRDMEITFTTSFGDAGDGCLYAQTEIEGGKKGLIFFEKKNRAFVARQREISTAMNTRVPIRISYRIQKENNETKVFFVA